MNRSPGKLLQKMRELSPLVHCITNFVTVNDCANILLAAGASPTMADTPEEMEEIVTLAHSLAVNIGTISTHSLPAMFCAARAAGKQHKPAILDPVGAGASRLRTRTALELLETGAFTVVRGNISEIRALAGEKFTSRGVDASAGDAVTEENLARCVEFAQDFARKYHLTLAISGAIDLLCDGKDVRLIRNGHPMMTKVTGCGCMSSVLCGAFAAADDSSLDSIAAAVSMMGVCGEIAYQHLAEGEGNASYRNRIIDAVYCITPEILERMAKIESL